MAKFKFKTNTHEIIKARYVEKKTFKRVLIALGCVVLLLGIATYRLYVLGDFKGILTHLIELL